VIELLNQPHFPTFLEAQFSSLAQNNGVCGAQLVIHQHDSTMAIEVGELEHHSGRPVTRDAAFPIGSITKSFTATLAMILVADGDLDVDEPLGDHLPELDDLGDLLTLRHLLSHTGGFASGPDSADLSTGSLRRYVADHCHRHNLVLPPGAGFSYSNMGYILVGRLIEAITGMSWAEAMELILLRPLGIAPAFVTGPAPVREVAIGHSVNLTLGRTQPVLQSLAAAEAPAGALAVSALDLVALGRLHLRPGMSSLLPPQHAERMRQPVPAATPFGLADGWGLGLALFGGATAGSPAAADEDHGWVGHDGNADGTACYLRIDPVGGWIVAMTANTSTGIGLWQDLIARLPDAGVPIAGAGSPAVPGLSAFAAPSVSVPPDCVGAYANGDDEYVVTGSDGRYSLAVDGEEYLVAAGSDGLTFALLDRASGHRLPGGRFQRDPGTGEINGIQVNGRLARRRVYAGAVAGTG
jgi:CubicO group peptidase (beta-lactamase class C family)